MHHCSTCLFVFYCFSLQLLHYKPFQLVIASKDTSTLWVHLMNDCIIFTSCKNYTLLLFASSNIRTVELFTLTYTSYHNGVFHNIIVVQWLFIASCFFCLLLESSEPSLKTWQQCLWWFALVFCNDGLLFIHHCICSFKRSNYGYWILSEVFRSPQFNIRIFL